MLFFMTQMSVSLGKNSIVFGGFQSIIDDPSENVFECWVGLIVTRPYDNGFLLLVKCKYSIEQFFKNYV